MYEQFINILNNNQLAQGGLFLAILGGLAYYIKLILPLLYSHIRRRIITSFTIRNEDYSYIWFNEWLSKNTNINKSRKYEVSSGWKGSQTKYPKHILTPGIGSHIFWYKKRLFIVSRERNEKDFGITKAGEDAKSLSKSEAIHVITFTRNQKFINDLLEEAKIEFFGDKDKAKVWFNNEKWWNGGNELKYRSLDGIILEDNLKENILLDIVQFYQNEQYYKDNGIPYHRGYLLKGEPGNGKTSLINAIASHLGCNVYALNLMNRSVDDSGLQELFSNISKKKSIILIEDIDCVFEERNKSKDTDNLLTFSGLLNALDGISTPDGYLLFATTNHPDKIDPALIRPGRIDLQIEIKNPSREMIIKLGEKLTPNCSPQILESFADKMVKLNKNMSSVQNLLIQYKDNLGKLINDKN